MSTQTEPIAELQTPPGFGGLVEFQPSFAPRPGISHVLFDFDGTLSLIRQGWPEVMVPMFVEFLPAKPGETEAERRQLCYDDIMRLNGKQTIYQMIQLAERIRNVVARPKSPLVSTILRRLDLQIASRVEALLRSVPSRMASWYGSREILENLLHRGLHLYLASGTDEPFVNREAELLGLTSYFGSHIYGALDDYKQFSKKMVIDRILRENKVPGDQLLSFGDGYVEIENTKEVGGLAVAVASDEAHNGSGPLTSGMPSAPRRRGRYRHSRFPRSGAAAGSDLRKITRFCWQVDVSRAIKSHNRMNRNTTGVDRRTFIKTATLAAASSPLVEAWPRVPRKPQRRNCGSGSTIFQCVRSGSKLTAFSITPLP
jgi:phosphoglycolate phosphatase-like HAD superfamily hydrolase